MTTLTQFAYPLPMRPLVPSEQAVPALALGNLEYSMSIHPFTRFQRPYGLISLHAWPTVRHSGEVRWDHNVPPCLLIWGMAYPLLDDPSRLAHEYPELAPLLSRGIIARRSLYTSGLRSLRDRAVQAGNQQVLAAILWEYSTWRAYDLDQIGKRIVPHLDGWGTQRAHWLWRGHQGYSRPTMDWHGWQDVSIYRILWTALKEDPLDDTMRPRKKAICPDPEFKLCVNPYHFTEAVPTRLAGTGYGRRFVGDVVPSYRPLWHAGRHAVRDERGNEYIACPNDPNHGPLEGRTQDQFNLGAARGRGYCPECYQVWKRNSRRVATARPYAAIESEPLERAQLEARAERQMATNDRMRVDRQRVEDAVRAIEDAFGPGSDPMHPADGI